MRFGLAFLVFLHHSLPLAAPSLYEPFRLNLGHIAVMVFYALSGFVIAEAVYLFYRDRPFSFLANRLLKLWPPYLAALGIAIACNGYVSHFGLWPGDDEFLTYQKSSVELLSLGTMLYNVVYIFPIIVSTVLSAFQSLDIPHLKYMFLRVAPTLQVEWFFYYIAFGATWLLYNVTKKAGMAITVGCLAIYLISELLLGRDTIWSYVPMFLIGVGVAILPRLEIAKRIQLAAMAVLYAAAVAQFIRFLVPAYPVAWKLVNAAGFLIFIVAMHMLSSQALSNRLKSVDQWFGNMSYPFYLNHSMVLFLAAAFLTTRGGWFWLAAFSAAFTMSWIMMVIVERPLMIIRDRVRGKKL